MRITDTVELELHEPHHGREPINMLAYFCRVCGAQMRKGFCVHAYEAN